MADVIGAGDGPESENPADATASPAPPASPSATASSPSGNPSSSTSSTATSSSSWESEAAAESHTLLGAVETAATRRIANFDDPHQEWRRMTSELVGTFLLVIAAAGAPMVASRYPGTVGLAMAVVAPGLTVLAVIMFMGRVSGAHLNPAVSCAFALRGDFPWARVPGYILAQVLGACLAAFVLTGLVGVSADLGGSYPGAYTTPGQAFLTETLLTFGLVSVILGTAAGAQSIGIIAAVAVAGYISLAGLWAAPLSGASMNPARTLGPNLVGGHLGPYWVYLAGPLLGAFLACVFAYVLRGPGGGRSGSLAAQGALHTRIRRPKKK